MPENHDKNQGLTYKIQIENHENYTYQFREVDNRMEFVSNGLENGKWAELEYHQCPNCTLDKKEYKNCPIASNLGSILKDWNEAISFSNVELTVINNQRTIVAKTTAQKALSSLIGLIMATSDCPHTQFFRPMAQFHLPLASNEETSYRAISTYLLTLYYRKLAGENVEFDLSGLQEIYENMHELNVHVKKRLEDAVKHDAALNAVTVLDIFTLTTTNFLDDELENLKTFFSIL